MKNIDTKDSKEVGLAFKRISNREERSIEAPLSRVGHVFGLNGTFHETHECHHVIVHFLCPCSFETAFGDG